jgi:uncharacterized protein YndB with AHSA1/START domain
MVKRRFKAPRDKVFTAWISPDQIKTWWELGEGWVVTFAAVDLRVGGKLHIQAKSKDRDAVHEVTGTFREVVPPRRLVYTWVVHDPTITREETLVTVEFHDRNGSTELVLKHESLKEGKLRGAVQHGWMLVLDGLRKFLVT